MALCRFSVTAFWRMISSISRWFSGLNGSAFSIAIRASFSASA